MSLRRTAIVAAASLPVIAAPGIALADTNPQSTAAHLCYLHRELCAEPQDNNLDGARVAVPPPTWGERVTATLGHALADIVFGPQW
jgi:hypothetical protein